MDVEKEDTTIYKVVVNHEEQYSILREHKDMPLGWRYAGKTGTKAECLTYIGETWTDMRPLSIRKRAEHATNDAGSSEPSSLGSSPHQEKSLVDRLCEEEQPVELPRRNERSLQRFKEAINRNYVHVKFTRTTGGTELGFKLDLTKSNLGAGDFENGHGSVHLEGDLTLDSSRVRCIADIDLATLEGRGRLVRVAASAEPEQGDTARATARG
ncbi:MAG: MbtH family NRPS accessory protein [Acidobacteriaceae bacterium]|nr:MbtH family NRPS accessory protein [Acidobacteriaceae bacterium]